MPASTPGNQPSRPRHPRPHARTDDETAEQLRVAVATETPTRTLAGVLARLAPDRRPRPRPVSSPAAGRVLIGGRRGLDAICTRPRCWAPVRGALGWQLSPAPCPHRIQVGWQPDTGELIAVLHGRGARPSRPVRVHGGPGAMGTLQHRLHRFQAYVPLLVRVRLWLRMARTYRAQAQMATVRAHQPTPRPDPDPTQP